MRAARGASTGARVVVGSPQPPVYSCGKPRDVVDGLSHRPRYHSHTWERVMAQRHAPPAQQVQVAERVTLRDGHRTVAGYVARNGRTYPHTVTDAGTERRVTSRLLSRHLRARRKPVLHG